MTCRRLGLFKSCWNQFRQICGSETRGFTQHATLLVETCNIQAVMDRVGCHWQDTLIEPYMQAARLTVWPMNTQGLHNPLYLENSRYNRTSVNQLDRMISLLGAGVREISLKCGTRAAEQLWSLLQKLRYVQGDAVMFDMDQWKF